VLGLNLHPQPGAGQLERGEAAVQLSCEPYCHEGGLVDPVCGWIELSLHGEIGRRISEDE
jgi:hypothetical protein